MLGYADFLYSAAEGCKPLGGTVGDSGHLVVEIGNVPAFLEDACR